jgi:integrase/recombinase XerC
MEALATLEALPSAQTWDSGLNLPALITNDGERATKRFFAFFTDTIRNPNTRRAYARAALEFIDCYEERGVSELPRIEPMMVAAY